MSDDRTTAIRPSGDVNVGGPDGDPPACTVGTVQVTFDGEESRRWLWNALDAVRRQYAATWGGNYPLGECSSGRLGYSTEHKDTDHCFCWLNAEEPCCWCKDDSEGEGEDAVCPGTNGSTSEVRP